MRMTQRKTAAAELQRTIAGEPGGGAPRPAVIAAIGEDPGLLSVQHGPDAVPAQARLAVAPPYRPRVGDRVLVVGGGAELYVIGVLHAAAPTVVALPDGGAIHFEGDAALIRDPEGRLLVRYANGVAEVAAPMGDLVLSAPAGRVVVRAGAEVLVEAPRLEVKTDESRLTTGHATLIADRIATTASAITQSVERLEITASRLVERTRDAYREATDLAETRAGRIRTLVKDVYTLYARRTTMASKEETSIDGSKVLLG